MKIKPGTPSEATQLLQDAGMVVVCGPAASARRAATAWACAGILVMAQAFTPAHAEVQRVLYPQLAQLVVNPQAPQKIQVSPQAKPKLQVNLQAPSKLHVNPQTHLSQQGAGVFANIGDRVQARRTQASETTPVEITDAPRRPRTP